jgi:hypothetical protein
MICVILLILLYINILLLLRSLIIRWLLVVLNKIRINLCILDWVLSRSSVMFDFFHLDQALHICCWALLMVTVVLKDEVVILLPAWYLVIDLVLLRFPRYPRFFLLSKLLFRFLYNLPPVLHWEPHLLILPRVKYLLMLLLSVKVSCRPLKFKIGRIGRIMRSNSLLLSLT